jgi:hypothetical protein
MCLLKGQCRVRPHKWQQMEKSPLCCMLSATYVRQLPVGVAKPFIINTFHDLICSVSAAFKCG